MAMQMCRKIDARKFYAPSKGYVSKLRGAVDSGYMYTMNAVLKGYLKDGCAIYPMIDSSPQGGRNNELSITSIVPKDALPDMLTSMHAMCNRLVST